MAFAAGTIWDVRSTGADTNGGGFDAGNASMATDLAATVATSAAPVVTSATYNFQARDVGHWLYVKSGTNWIPGFYQIASVAVNAATLTATIGTADIVGNPWKPSEATGCATTASPTAGTWSIDYSRSTGAAIAFTDMVIDASVNTKFTSAANPVGKNFIGNTINVVSGTGFSVQRIQVLSTVTTLATCDKAIGTTSSTGGTGSLGGSLATVALAVVEHVSRNTIYLKLATYTITLDLALITSTSSLAWTALIGYSSMRGDGSGTAAVPVKDFSRCPTIQAVSVFSGTAVIHGITNTYWRLENLIFDCNGQALRGVNAGANYVLMDNCKVMGVSQYCVVSGGALLMSNCHLSGATIEAVTGTNTQTLVENTIVTGNAIGIDVTGGPAFITGCLIYSNTGDGLKCTSGVGIQAIGNTIAYNGGAGVDITTTGIGTTRCTRNIIANNTGAGFLSGTAAPQSSSDWNAYYSNSTPYTSVPAGPHDVILTATPFVDGAGGNFTLNTTAGGGAACRRIGPGMYGNTTNTDYSDLGGLQSIPGGPVGTNLRGGFANG